MFRTEGVDTCEKEARIVDAAEDTLTYERGGSVASVMMQSTIAAEIVLSHFWCCYKVG